MYGYRVFELEQTPVIQTVNLPWYATEDALLPGNKPKGTTHARNETFIDPGMHPQDSSTLSIRRPRCISEDALPPNDLPKLPPSRLAVGTSALRKANQPYNEIPSTFARNHAASSAVPAVTVIPPVVGSHGPETTPHSILTVSRYCVFSSKALLTSDVDNFISHRLVHIETSRMDQL